MTGVGLRAGDPAVIGGYRLAARLGEGGQGTVYLAYGTDGTPVAVKTLHLRFGDDATARARFAREVAATRRVAPFCTARVLAADVDGSVPYLVSEYIDGRTLRDIVDHDGPLREPRLRHVAIGTLTALAAIHEAGIVHRDFKPGNVLLSPTGPRVVDFGIARALDGTSTLTSQAIGTPAYMAPEQFGGGPVGPAIDMFAWGGAMVYAATGAPPFGGDTVPAVIGAILDGEPDLSGLTGALREPVAACLAKDPARRPAAQDLLNRLLATRDTARITLVDAARAAAWEPGDLAAPRRPGWWRSRRALVIGIAVVAAVALVAGGVRLLGGAPTSAAAPRPTSIGPTPDAANGLFATPPDPCEAVRAQPPPAARGIKPVHDQYNVTDQSCSVASYGSARTRVLKLRAEVYPTVSQASGFYASDRRFKNGHGYGPAAAVTPAEVPANEGFAAPYHDVVTYGDADHPARTYHLDGVTAEVRLRNAVITATWMGADYPKRVRHLYTLRGTGLPYARSRTEVMAMMRRLVSGLR